jgi:hypothetical protein
MAGRRHRPFAPGSPRPTYRGSRKRLKRIRILEDTSVDFWLLVILMLFMLLVVLPWLITHPLWDHDEGDDHSPINVTVATA